MTVDDPIGNNPGGLRPVIEQAMDVYLGQFSNLRTLVLKTLKHQRSVL